MATARHDDGNIRTDDLHPIRHIEFDRIRDW